MSTRSFVGVMSDAGILGAYVHGDGHPSWVGTQVQKILKRDGFEKFGQTILEGCEGGGFSWLDADTNANQEDRRCKIIGGYGGAYTDESGCEPMTLRGGAQSRRRAGVRLRRTAGRADRHLQDRVRGA